MTTCVVPRLITWLMEVNDEVAKWKCVQLIIFVLELNVGSLEIEFQSSFERATFQKQGSCSLGIAELLPALNASFKMGNRVEFCQLCVIASNSRGGHYRFSVASANLRFCGTVILPPLVRGRLFSPPMSFCLPRQSRPRLASTSIPLEHLSG